MGAVHHILTILCMKPNLPTSERLHSLDVLRGFDMFFIMGGDALLLYLCWMFPGTWMEAVAPQLGHPAWHGFTAYDLIFPLFLFIAGVSFPFSFHKQMERGQSLKQIQLRIVRRGLTLVVLGMVYNGLLSFDFEHLRVASVLGRIGLAWMLAALAATLMSRRSRYVLMAVILMGYWALLALVGAPDSDAERLAMEGNIVSYVDRLLLPGVLHNGIHDPEGLLGTLPAMCTALIGMEAGEAVRQSRGSRTCLWLATAGALLVAVAWGWNFVLPINKNLWTSSFVCITGGISLMLFSAFHYLIDLRGWRKGTLFFSVIGLNSITIYLAQQFIDFRFTARAIFGGAAGLLPEAWQGVALAAGYVAVCWGFLYFLHRQRIYLKV